MRYALVMLPPDSKSRLILETVYIAKFEEYDSTTKNKIFRYNDGENKYKCVILHVSDSVEELEDPKLRVRIPKLINLSSLDSSSSSEEETDLTKTKRNRKNKKQGQLTLKKKKVDNILRAHKSATHIRESSPKDIEFDEENRDLDNHDKAEVPEADNQKKFAVIPESDEVNVSDDEETNDEEDVIGDFHSDRKVIGAEKTNNRESSRAEMIKKLPNPVNLTKFNVKPGTSKVNVSDDEETNDEEDVIGDFHSDRKVIGAEKTNNRESSRAEMIKKLPNSVNPTKFNVKPGTSKSGNIDVPENGQEKIKVTSDKHVQLDDHLAQLHQQRKLEEKRLKEEEQAILERRELERQRHRTRVQQQRRLLETQKQQRRNRNDNDIYLQNDQFLLGDDFYISSAAYRDANTADTPSRFIIRMAHAIWPTAELAQRVIRKQSNTGDRKSLTPRKVELLSYRFEEFLVDRNYSEERTGFELAKMNKYLGESITSAKKKLGFSKGKQSN